MCDIPLSCTYPTEIPAALIPAGFVVGPFGKSYQGGEVTDDQYGCDLLDTELPGSALVVRTVRNKRDDIFSLPTLSSPFV